MASLKDLIVLGPARFLDKLYGNLEGNASTATKLQTPRAINGTNFDGTGDITTANWGTARTITISDNSGTNTQANTGINGSTNFTLKLPATIKANLTGKATSAGTADSATTATTAGTTTGNAGSATKLQTARTINGTSFDGTGNITTSYWGTARNVYIIDSDSNSANKSTAVSVNGNTDITLKMPSTFKMTKTQSITVAGDANTYYPVVISMSTAKDRPHGDFYT